MPHAELEALRKQLHELIDIAISNYKNKQHSKLTFAEATPGLPYHTIPQIRDLIKASISCLVEEIKRPEFTLATIAYELSKHVTLLEGDLLRKGTNGIRWNNQVSAAIRQWDSAVNGPHLIAIIYNRKNRYCFASTAHENVFEIETIAEADSRISGQAMKLSSWITKSQIAKTTAYKLLTALKIEPLKARVPGSRVPVSWLSVEMINTLEPVVKRFHEGTTIANSLEND